MFVPVGCSPLTRRSLLPDAPHGRHSRPMRGVSRGCGRRLGTMGGERRHPVVEGPVVKPAPLGLFSLLDPQETKRKAPRAKRKQSHGLVEVDRRSSAAVHAFGVVVPVPTPREEGFRHSGWAAGRRRVRAALVATGATAARLTRFDNCGGGAWVERSEQGGVFRLRATYCRDRMCVPCCTARAKRVANRITAGVSGQRCQFITLTLARDDRPLAQRITRLVRAFAVLRKTSTWRNGVTGSASCIEITRGARGDHWHVHCHIVTTGPQLTKGALSSVWHEVTGDSFIVDVQEIRDLERGVAYVAKYASKGVDGSVYGDPDALQEAVTALKGRRLLLVVGVWKGLAAAPLPSRFSDWEQFGGFDEVLDRAAAGEAMAITAVLALRMGTDLRGEEAQGWIHALPPPAARGV